MEAAAPTTEEWMQEWARSTVGKMIDVFFLHP